MAEAGTDARDTFRRRSGKSQPRRERAGRVKGATNVTRERRSVPLTRPSGRAESKTGATPPVAARQHTWALDLPATVVCGDRLGVRVHGDVCGARHACDLHHAMDAITQAFCTFEITRIRHAIGIAFPL
jgi:hypothetical protein